MLWHNTWLPLPIQLWPKTCAAKTELFQISKLHNFSEFATSIPLIIAKVRQIQEFCNQHLPTDECLNLSFRGSGLANYKPRWTLKSFSNHGQSEDVDTAAVKKQCLIYRKYNQNLWTKRCLQRRWVWRFYNLAPYHTVSSHCSQR